MNRRTIERVADRCVPRFLTPHAEKVQYLVVGAYNTVFGYVVWAVLYGLLAGLLGYAPVLVISYAIAIANAYVLYRFVVFRSHGRVWRELPRFSTVYLTTMVVNLIVFPLAVHRIPLSPYAIQALFTLAVVAASYLAHKRFSFGAGAAESRYLRPESTERLR